MTVGFYCNTPIYRTIPDAFTRMPVQLPSECLRLIHRHMEFTSGSTGCKPKSYPVPWHIEPPHPKDCIYMDDMAGRMVFKKNITDSDRSGFMTRVWYDPEHPDYVDQQNLASWFNEAVSHPLIGPSKRQGAEALGEVELPSGEKIFRSDDLGRGALDIQIIEHVNALRRCNERSMPSTFLDYEQRNAARAEQRGAWDLDYEHDETLFYQTIHLPQMDVFGMGIDIIRQTEAYGCVRCRQSRR